MIGKGGQKDIDIIEVNQDAGQFKIANNVVHSALKRCWRITKTLGHMGQLVQTAAPGKGCLGPILQVKLNFPKPTSKIEAGYEFDPIQPFL